MLSVRLGGLYGMQEISGPKPVNTEREVINTRNTLGATWNAEWSFLPKTSIFVDGHWQTNTWENDIIPINNDPSCTEGCATLIPASNSVMTVAGLSGQVTSKLLLKLRQVQERRTMVKLPLRMLRAR